MKYIIHWQTRTTPVHARAVALELATIVDKCMTLKIGAYYYLAIYDREADANGVYKLYRYSQKVVTDLGKIARAILKQSYERPVIHDFIRQKITTYGEYVAIVETIMWTEKNNMERCNNGN